MIALGHYMRADVTQKQIPAHIETAPFRRAGNAGLADARKWLSNAWNTERLLRLQTEMDAEAQRFAVQWAFPQAYYASFCQVLGLFAVIGHADTTHAGVVRRFGALAQEGKLPLCLAAYANGGRNEVVVTGVRKGNYPSPIYLELEEPASVENQVAQLLSSTRRKALDEKKENFKFMTSSGARKKNLNRQDWTTISDRLGPTTALAYLYRKRIKANYRDIDSLLRSEIDGPGILRGLVNVVSAFALLCEGYVYALANRQERDHFTEHPLYSEQFLEERRAALKGQRTE